MKPIAPMSKDEKEKRKFARAAKAKTEATKDKAMLAGPPKDFKSISGATYPGSTAKDWTYYPGPGWLNNCETCWFAERYRKDIQTEKWHIRQSMIELGDGEGHIHKSTLALGHYVQDQITGKVWPKADCFQAFNPQGLMVWAYKNNVIGKHYYNCPVANKLFAKQHMQYYHHPHTPGWSMVSHYAINTAPHNSLFSECPQCNETTEKAGIIQREGANGKMCPDCYHKLVKSTIIHEYNHKGYPNKLSSNPTLKLLVKNKLTDVPDESHRLFGVECEVEIADGCPLDRWQLALNVQAALGKDFVVMKNDGSLKEHPKDSPIWGFEIVSAPADFAVHEAKWSKLEAAEGFKYLRAWQTITCGMHVHVGKASLSPLQIGRIVVFINSPKNRKFIEVVAGRNSKAASRFLGEKKLSDGLTPDPDKYCAVNYKPEHTIEFRIFRGTIRYKHIMRNIEFCDAVCAYCYPAARSFADMDDYKKFIEFCKVNRKKYPIFTNWMENYKYIPARKLPPGRTIEEVVEAVPVTTESQPKWY